MYITSNYHGQPLSTAVINRAGGAAQKNVVPASSDPSLTTPEDVNRAVDGAEQRVNSAAETRESNQQRQRYVAAQTNAQRNQKAQAELYVSIASGGESADAYTPVTAQQLSSFYPPIRTSRLAEAIDGIELDAITLQADLQIRIDRAVGDHGSQSSLSILV